MAFADISAPLLARIDGLGTVGGRLEVNRPLAPLTWFRVGGVAQLLYSPASVDELAHFLSVLDPAIPVTVLGLGSNLLVRDGGVGGVVIRLGRGFFHVERKTPTQLVVGAGLPDRMLARHAAAAGIGGLEFYGTIPGAIGGALRMNAGAHGTETADRLVCATALDRRGRRCTFAVAGMDYSYRHCGLPEGLIFIEATFEGFPAGSEEITEKMNSLQAARAASQPLREKTGGSTFKNPPNHKAWQLIDAAGCRGLARGGAAVSRKHCNFLINRDNATAADLEDLGETVRARVRDSSGITLEWEIRRIGTRQARPQGANSRAQSNASKSKENPCVVPNTLPS